MFITNANCISSNKGKIKVEDLDQFKWNLIKPNRTTCVTQRIVEEDKNNTRFKLRLQNQRKCVCKTSRRSPKSSLSVSKFKISTFWNKSKSSQKNTKPSKSNKKLKKSYLRNQSNIELSNLKEWKDIWGYSNLSEFVEKNIKTISLDEQNDKIKTMTSIKRK